MPSKTQVKRDVFCTKERFLDVPTKLRNKFLNRNWIDPNTNMSRSPEGTKPLTSPLGWEAQLDSDGWHLVHRRSLGAANSDVSTVSTSPPSSPTVERKTAPASSSNPVEGRRRRSRKKKCPMSNFSRPLSMSKHRSPPVSPASEGLANSPYSGYVEERPPIRPEVIWERPDLAKVLLELGLDDETRRTETGETVPNVTEANRLRVNGMLSCRITDLVKDQWELF